MASLETHDADRSDVEAFDESIEDLEFVPLVPTQGEDDDDSEDSAAGFAASVASKDWTVETLVSQMRKGRIDLAPSFQRRNAWLGNRKSKLIESILLGFPIPQIVLAEKHGAPGQFFVLDGKQRLLALRQFFADPADPQDSEFDSLTLSGLEVLPDLNRKTISHFEAQRPDLLAALENHSIRTVVLSRWNSENLLLSLFLRLNTGSVPLSPQELRQALIPGVFMSWLDDQSGSSEQFRDLLNNKHPDRRMADAELTLRHLSFSCSSGRYRGNLKEFLDNSSREFTAAWPARGHEVQEAFEQLEEGIKLGLSEFGHDRFCRKWSATKFERALNRAIFDVQTYSLSFPRVREAVVGRGESIMAEFAIQCGKEAFARSITTTTKTAEAFITRHRVWAEVLRKTTGVSYELPRPLVRE